MQRTSSSTPVSSTSGALNQLKRTKSKFKELDTMPDSEECSSSNAPDKELSGEAILKTFPPEKSEKEKVERRRPKAVRCFSTIDFERERYRAVVPAVSATHPIENPNVYGGVYLNPLYPGVQNAKDAKRCFQHNLMIRGYFYFPAEKKIVYRRFVPINNDSSNICTENL